MRTFAVLFIAILSSCHPVETQQADACPPQSDAKMKGALLASRINKLDELKQFVSINYYVDDRISEAGQEKNNKVILMHCNGNKQVQSILKAGLSQDDITKARDGNFLDQLALLIQSPYTIANRKKLNDIYTLSRWNHDKFGWHDVAFYNLAVEAEKRIRSTEKAYINPRDSSEKGYINTFNHITAQAFITAIFSEEVADFIADLHELHNMPELVHGNFTSEQLADPNTNPIDNYVDMINNEWGQALGNDLKEKYGINAHTRWTPELTANFINDLQSYYSWAFELSMTPFDAHEDLMIQLSNKLNAVCATSS